MLKRKTTTKASEAAETAKPSKLPIPRRKPAPETFSPAKPTGRTPKAAKPARGREPAAPTNAPAEAEPKTAPAKPAAADAVSAVASPQKPAGKLSCLDAAAEVLRAAAGPMRVREMVAAMAAGGLWHSEAPTPHQTLASALLREIAKKGPASRFRRADRGQFALNADPA